MSMGTAFLNDPNFYYCLQLLLAMSLGLILGVERTIAGRTAGMRTYALVSMGSCLLIVMSNLVIHGMKSQGFDFDPIRIAVGVVTGIGFLGAGAILFKEGDSKISGLTTAAGLWVASAVGMTVGYGFYTVAIFATILTIIAFTFLWHVELDLKKYSDKIHSQNGML